MKKPVPIEVLEHWLLGERLCDLSVLVTTPEESRRLTNKLNMLQGRFDILPKDQQDRAYWKARALVFADKTFRNSRGLLGRAAADAIAAHELGCGASSLRKWRPQVENSNLGAGYWHLLLVPHSPDRKGLVKTAPAAWIRIKELLIKGARPTEIPKLIKAEIDVEVSSRTVLRIAKSEAEQGRLNRVQFINRFK